jgi:hypothetical protein
MASIVGAMGHAAGGFVVGGAQSLLGKRKSPELKNASASQCQKLIANSFRGGEMIERKRLPPASYRLHAAKWLVMDKMLKQLLFPLQSLKNNFGFTSYSGINKLAVEDALDIDNSMIGKQRTGGCYRGVAFFDIRTTNAADTPVSNNTLNADPKIVGGVSGNNVNQNFDVDSVYRTFHNGPKLDNVNTGGTVVQPYDGNVVTQTEMQAFESVPASTISADAGTTARSLGMGINLSQVESASVNAMCYADPVFTAGRLITAGQPGAAGAAALVSNLNNTELITGQGGINPGGNSLYQSAGIYNGQVRNGIVRIADGKVTMDIMNTENTPCVVEIVIHSKKKNNLTKQDCFNRLFNDAQVYYASKGVTAGTTANDANSSGGWQTLYDPDVPLLKLPASSPCYTLMSEVHRSNHILAPGQSKLVTIALGSHWYKLINKNDATANLTAVDGFDSFVFNSGSLFCSVGHSGFMAAQGIQTMTDGTANTNLYTKPGAFSDPVRGSGWWVGATHTQSSILVSGGYEEKFYPLTFDRSQVDHTTHHIHRPAFLQNGNNTGIRPAVPTVQIIPEKVVTASSTFRDTTFSRDL